MNHPKSLENLSPEEQRALLQNLLKQKSQSGKRFPMSEGQQGLWYAFRRDPQQTNFNVFLPSRVRSPLDLAALKSAMEFLVQRHPCLRTTFTDEGAQLNQQVHDRLPPEFSVIDAHRLSESALRQAVIEETQKPFDLEKGPLLRLIVWKHRDDDFVVLASTHHIVTDFWSLVLLLDELREAYPAFAAQQSPQLPKVSGHYRSFVERQKQIATGSEAEHHRAYWRRQLRDVPNVLNWITDFERPDRFTGRANVQALEFSSELLGRLVQVAREAKTTTSAVVLAGVQAFIAATTRQKSFMIGTPFSGRGSREFERTVGFFVNMLPLKADVTDDPTFLDLARRVGHSLIAALEHQDYPLPQIVRDLQPVRDPSRTPLFQVSCTFEKAQIREESGRAGFLFPSDQQFEFGGLTQESYYVPHPTCHYDVEFVFEQTETALRGMICYCRDLFSVATMEQFATNLQSYFEALLLAPRRPINRIDWGVSPQTPSLHLVGSDPTTIVNLLDEIPASHPNSLATLSGGISQTHRELLEQSKRIARHLAAEGVGRRDLVPVIARRGPRALAAILGVIRSGAAVIPIDAEQPAISIDDLRLDANPKAILFEDQAHSSQDQRDHFQIEELCEPIEADDPTGPIADDLAYVIYTSGSTGKPKGVMVRHSAIVNTLRWRMDAVGLKPEDRLMMMLSHQFDAGFGLMLSSIVQGSGLVWPDEDAAHDLNRLIDQLCCDRVSVLASVPSWFRLLAAQPGFKDCQGVHDFWMGGETMPADLPGLLRQHSNARIWNFYGPTETSIEAAAWEVKDHDKRQRIPIGRAITNTELLILNEQRTPLPDTVPGQLAIRGRGLADGYLNDPDLTRKKFVPIHDPSTSEIHDRPQSNGLIEGERMYLTGDLCRRRPDGAIEFLGRMDDQVKLHGHRIELEEIDAILQSHEGVENAAVRVLDPDTVAARIAAYVTRVDRAIPESKLIDSLKLYVAKKLPQYKRPSSITLMDRLPIGSSGKVVRRLLPEVAASADNEYLAPSTPLEQYLSDRWGEHLQLDRVGVNQNFFQLGGTSLQAAMLTAKLSEDLEVHVPTALLFDLADIAQISQRLVQLHEVEIAERFGIESVTAYSQSQSAELPHESARTSEMSMSSGHPLLAELKPDGSRPPLFLVHPPGGIVVCYRELATQLSPQQPLIAIRSRGLHGSEKLPSSIEEMASDYIAAIRATQPQGPYVVGGWSLGGLVGYEIARQLMNLEEEVTRLILLDTTIPDGSTDLVDANDQTNVGREYGLDLSLQDLNELPAEDQLPFLWDHAVKLGVLNDDTPADVVAQVLQDLQSLFQHHVRLASDYRLAPIDADVLLLRPRDVPFDVNTRRDRGWGKLVNQVNVREVPGHHHSMVQMPHVAELASVIEQELITAADKLTH